MANDLQVSASFSARKKPQRISANTLPVFSSLAPLIYQQLLCLATIDLPGQRGLTLFEKSLHLVEETIAVFFDRHAALFAEFLEQFLLASGQFGGNLNFHDK